MHVECVQSRAKQTGYNLKLSQLDLSSHRWWLWKWGLLFTHRSKAARVYRWKSVQLTRRVRDGNNHLNLYCLLDYYLFACKHKWFDNDHMRKLPAMHLFRSPHSENVCCMAWPLVAIQLHTSCAFLGVRLKLYCIRDSYRWMHIN